MVKFSKQFEGQLIPEWKEAFVDYWQLKKDLKRFHPIPTTTHNNINIIISSSSSSFKQIKKPTNFNFFSSTLSKFSLKFSNKNKDHQPIQVHRKLASSASGGDMYETELLEQFGEGSDAVKEFFACLDKQLNKVNAFYTSKENEFVERGESMKKQLEILLQLKAALTKHHRHHNETTTKSGIAAADSSRELDASILCTFSTGGDEDFLRDDREEQEQLTDDSSDSRQEIPFSDLSVKSDDVGKAMRSNSTKLSRSLSSRSVSCQGKTVRVTIPLTTPTRTFSAISSLLFQDLINQSSTEGSSSSSSRVSINKAKLHRAEKMIRGAFVELYKGLRYLETYRSLNMLAFLKILKKFDKVTGKQVQPIYVRVVEGSYFNSSNKVMHLADQVEQLFIKNFASEDRTKAMKYLKPDQRKDTHSITFFVGLFSGCFISLLVGYIIMAHITGTYTRRHDDTLYMETAYPVFSMFSLMFLHVFLYGCNIFAWRKTRINYSFIFELAPTKELKYRDMFLISATSMTVVVGVMFAHLSLLSKGYSYAQVQAIPGFLLLVFLLVLVCPLNIVYRSSRYRFLRALRNIALSPLYKVVMLDFFMADQLCSQVPMLRNFEYIACYYITGSYKNQDYGYCMRNRHYQDLAYAVSFLPYYWRAMQCGRRWFDEGKTSHLVNLGKYMSAMVAAGTKVAYEKEKTVGWLCLVVTVSSLATVYQLYWDFVKDWGLLKNNSNNPWLRNELMLRPRLVYYISMGLNLILRLAWLQTVLHSNFGHVDYRVTGLFLAALEVIRRGLWNFFRLENEHLNNAGKFRAVKIVPLPFHQVNEED